MPKKSVLKCHFGCDINGGSLHRFPKWDYPHTEKFNTWKSVLNPATQERGNNYIYNSVRICHRHFKDCYKLPSRQLTNNAMPTLNLIPVHGNVPTLEHSYSSQQLDTQSMPTPTPNDTMKNVCRLCLSVACEDNQKLFESGDILHKMRSCVPHQIVQNELLPDKICKVCIGKINMIYEFQYNIKENEEKLQSLLLGNKRELLHFYNTLKMDTKTQIKDELEIEEDATKEEEVSIVYADAHCSSDDDINLHIMKCKKEKAKVEKKKRLKSIILQEPLEADPNNDSEIIEEVQNQSFTMKFNCVTCFANCESQIDLLKHYYKEHKVKPDDNLKEFIIKINHNKMVMFQCRNCEKRFRTNHSALRHLNVHSSVRPYKCNKCDRTYKTVEEIVRHARVHNGLKLFCSKHCGYSTAYKGALKDHEMRHNENPLFKYTCGICGKGFNVHTWFVQHQNSHNGVKPFVCNLCGKAFHIDRYLTSHKNSVHNITVCQKKYACTECQTTCECKRSLREHMMKVHGVRVSSLLCDMCGKVLVDAQALKFHRNLHQGVRPYVCSVCNKTFAKKYNLQCHVRTHTRAREHACVCGRVYCTRSALRRHHRSSHSESQLPLVEDDNVKCSNCQETFAHKQLLKTHMKICVDLS